MAALDIDAIYQALFDRLQTELAGDIKLFTRRAEHFESSLSQPALLLVASAVTPSQEKGLPPLWRLGAKVLVYVKQTDGAISPESALLVLLGKIEAALQRKSNEPGGPDADEWGTSLGGLVSSVSMTGVEMDTGLDSGQGALVVDLAMATHT